MSKTNGAKNTDEPWKVSGITHNYPSYRSRLVASVDSWLQGKRDDDGAEGLWRIKDTLYDFTDFVDRHPGGAFWLQQTKGVDITEPFESHHISTLPESMLKKFEVRKATKPRNYKLTMHEYGFYKTLKRRVRDKLTELDYSPSKRSDLIHFGLLTSTLGLAAASLFTCSTILGLLSALALCWLAICSHNYFHRRDNWQMYAFNLSLLNFTTWRVSHALSHHVYPNSLLDLEMAIFEPLLSWIPNKNYGSKVRRVVSALLQPVLYTVTYFVDYLMRLSVSFTKQNLMHWHDLIFLTMPAVMWIASGSPLGVVVRQWSFILVVSSFLFSFIGLTAAHHTPAIYHDGDAMREDMDWGIFQVDTIIDRQDIKGSQFLVLTHFGDHVLHHLFPTLDHGILPQLYPLLEQTMKEFEVELRECSHMEHIIGQSQQLIRTTPNPLPPGTKSKRG